MGKVKDTLFGKPAKSKEESASGNHAWEPISSAYTPALNYVTGGGDMMGSLLGVGGGPAQTQALENFANSGGMEFLREQGNRQITSNKAASGLLKSGSFGTALAKYGQGLGSTYLNQYMNNLKDYATIGLGAGGVMSDAGRWSEGEGSSNGGKKGLLSSFAEGAGKAAAAGGGGG